MMRDSQRREETRRARRAGFAAAALVVSLAVAAVAGAATARGNGRIVVVVPATNASGGERGWWLVDPAGTARTGRGEVPHAVRATRDGRRLAFVCGGGVCVSAADGSQRRRVASGHPAYDWSPDGRTLVLVSNGVVRMLDVASGRRGVVRRIARANGYTVAWSPAGDRIAVHPFDRRRTLAIVSANGRKVVRGPRVASAGTPSWSADGRLVAVGEGRVSIVAAATGRTRTVVPGWRPRFSPRHRHTLLVGSGSGSGSVAVVDVGRGTRRGLADGGAQEPVWSPDGRYVAYAAARGLVIVRADGTGARTVFRPTLGDAPLDLADTLGELVWLARAP
jgi:Tol biopolymer transport system component